MTLDEIAARADKATEGPWVQRGCTPCAEIDRLEVNIWDHTGNFLITSWCDDDDHPGPDAEFIAHAREDVPKLVAALRAVEALHVPWDSEEFYNDIDGGSRSTIKHYCGTCVDGNEVPYSWPCPTITAIREALA